MHAATYINARRLNAGQIVGLIYSLFVPYFTVVGLIDFVRAV